MLGIIETGLTENEAENSFAEEFDFIEILKQQGLLD
jgi:hypothetical protein